MDPPVQATHGLLWRTETEREFVKMSMQNASDEVKRTLNCFRPVPSMLAGVRDVQCFRASTVDMYLRDAYSPGCLLYLIYACRMGRTMMGLDRLLSTTTTVAPVGRVPTASMYLRLGLRDKRLKDRLHPDGATPPLHRDRMSVHWDSQAALVERILVSLWMRAAKEAAGRTVFANDVMRIINGADCAERLHRRLFQWCRCILQGRMGLLEEVAPPGPMSSVEAGTFPGESAPVWPTVPKPPILHWADVKVHIEKHATVTQNQCWEEEHRPELIRFAIAKMGVGPERDGVIAYLHRKYHYSHPDPHRGQAELCLHWVLDILNEWQKKLVEQKDVFYDALGEEMEPPTGAGSRMRTAVDRLRSFILARVPLWWSAPLVQAPRAAPQVSSPPAPVQEDVPEDSLDAMVTPIVELLVQFLTDDPPPLTSPPTAVEVQPVLHAVLLSVFTSAVTLHHYSTYLQDAKDWVDPWHLEKATDLQLVEDRQTREMHRQLDATTVSFDDLSRALRLLEDACEIGIFACLDHTTAFQHFVSVQCAAEMQALRGRDDEDRRVLFRLLRICKWSAGYVRSFIELPDADARAVASGASTQDLGTLVSLRSTIRPEAGCAAGKELAAKVHKCSGDSQIIRTVHRWLAKNGYGERRYVAETLAKRQKSYEPIDTRSHWG